MEERHLAREDALSERARDISVEHGRSIIDGCVEGIVVIDGEGKIVYANPAFTGMMGDGTGAIAGTPHVSELIAFPGPDDGGIDPKEPSGGICTLMRGIDGDRRVLVRLETLSRSEHRALYLSPLSAGRGPARPPEEVFGTFTFRLQLSPPGGIVRASEGLFAITGYTPAECCRNTDAIRKIVHPADHPLLTSIRRGEFLWDNPVRIRLMHKDGSVVWVEMHLRRVVAPEGGIVAVDGTATDITQKMQAEQMLRDGERALRTFVNAIPGIAVLVDRRGMVVTINETGARQMGKNPHALIGQPLADNLPGEMKKEIRRLLSRIARTGTPYQRLHTIGSRQITMTVYPIFGEDGGVTHFAILGEDVTERGRMETAFRESEERFHLAAQAANLGIWDADLQTGDQVYCERWASMLGYTLEEVNREHITWRTLVHPDDYQKALERRKAHCEGDEALYEADFRMRCRDGSWKWIHSSGKLIERDANGNPVRLIGVHMDIDDRRLAEEALRQREAHLSAILNAARGVAFITADAASPDFKILDFSPGAEEIFGYGREEMVTEPLSMLYAAGDAGALPEIIASCRASDEWCSREMTLLRKGEERFPGLCTIYPLYEESGDLRALLHITVDVSELREAERARHVSEERYQALVESCPDPILLFADNKLLFINSAGIQQLGAGSAEKLLGRSALDLIDPVDSRFAEEQLRNLISKNRPVPLTECRVRRVDGTVIDTEIVAVPVVVHEKSGFMVIARDISRRKQAERALIESEERYRSLVEYLPEAILVHNGERILFSNSAGLALLGASRLSNVAGRSVREFISPEFHAEMERFMAAETDRGAPIEHLEERIITLGGDIIDVGVTRVKVMYKGEHAVQVLLRDITARKKAEEQIQFWHRQLTISNEIIKVANSSLILEEMMERILTMTIELLDFDVGGIFLKNTDGRTAGLVIAEGAPDTFMDRMGSIYIHDWPHNLPFFAGQPHYVQNIPGDEPGKIDAGILEDMDCRIYAGIPLIADSLVVGAVYIGSRQRGSFSPRERQILESIGREIGGTVLRGLLQDQLEEAYAEASTYLDILENDLQKANAALLEYAVVVRDMLEGSGECYAEKLQAVIRQSIDIISNIATIRRLKDQPEEFEPVELDTVVRREIEKFPDVRITYQPTGLIVFADGLIAEIFSNIIGNSVKYGGPEVKIMIRAEEFDGMIRVSIEDTGPGVPDDEKHCLFSAFREHAPSAQARGLGLQVSRLLVDRYCGTIAVEDRVPGKPSAGLAVRFTLAPYETDTVDLFTGDPDYETEAVRNRRGDA